MLLQELPSEILTRILDNVGSAYFQEDVRRLTVNKQWFITVHTIFFRKLKLASGPLRRLFSSAYAEHNLSMIKNETRSLDLDPWTFKNWQSHPELMDHYEQLTSPNANVHAIGPALQLMKNDWRVNLYRDLDAFADIRFEKVRTLRLCVSPDSPETIGEPWPEYRVDGPTIQRLLSIGNLTVLDLDLGLAILSTQESDDYYHICPIVAGLLPTLQSLKLRQYEICPDALRPPASYIGRLRLSEIIVNLAVTFKRDASGRVFVLRSRSCWSTLEQRRKRHLQNDMADQAKALVNRMSSPTMVRVVNHSFKVGRSVSNDVLTGKVMELSEDSAWEDDGEEVVDMNWEDLDPEVWP